MTEEKPARSRFGRIRGVGENVTEAVQAVTGQSVTEDIAEFTEAYTEVLTGLHGEVQSLRHKVDESELKSAQSTAELLDEVSRLERTALIAVVTAAVGITLGIVAVVLVVAI